VVWINISVPGSSALNSSKRSVRRAANESFAPIEASSLASALPIPEEAPVITITLFFTQVGLNIY
jgi:hypothetical protein